MLIKIPTAVKVASLIIILIVALTAILSSEYSVRYIAKRMAAVSKTITETYKRYGMDTAEVEAKLSFGFLSFKVRGKDKMT